MPYRNKTTGEVLSDQDYQARFGGQDSQQSTLPVTPQQPQRLSFLERAKLSFGGPEEIQKLKQSEEAAGLRGVLDVGDIADVAGTALPAIGAAIGGVAAGPTALFSGPVGPSIGAGIGAAAGEAVRQTVGQVLGVRRKQTPVQEAVSPLISGAATAALSKAGESVGRFISSRIPKLLGLFTGESDVVSAALRNPKVADFAINQGDEALRQAVQQGSQRSVELKKNFLTAHSQAINNEVFKDMKVSEGYGRKIRQEVIQKFYGYLKANNVKQVAGDLDFTTSKIKANPGEIAKIQSAAEAIQNWSNWSQRGVHELKQLIGQLTKFPNEAGGSSKSPFLGRMYGFLNEKVKEGLPKNRQVLYSEINKKFENNIDLFDDLVDAFNHGDPFTKMAQVFGRNRDSLRMILDFYEKKTGIDIPAIVAGRELAVEKTVSPFIFTPRALIDFFLLPKRQAKFVTGVGRFQQFTREVASEPIRRATRGFVSETIQKSLR